MSGFNLLTEPWIRVVDLDGHPQTVGLRDALMRADRLAGFADPDPGVEAAIFRLTIAVVHAAAFRHLADGEPSAIESSWPSGDIDSYLESVADRFDLFDETAPFLQAPHAAVFEAKTPWTLAAPFAPGAGSQTFIGAGGQIPADTDAMNAADAARYLVAAQAWGNGQKTSGPLPGSTNASTPAGVLAGSVSLYPLGSTLAETLLLNITPTETPGAPVWEVEPGTAPSGLLGRLVWPARSYLLDHDSDGRVVGVRLGVGHRPDVSADEPHFIYRKGAYLRGSADRVLWREVPTIYGWEEDTHCQQLVVVKKALQYRSPLGRAVLYARNNVGTVVATINERTFLPLPYNLLGERDEVVASLIVDALAKTTKAVGALRRCLVKLYPSGRLSTPAKSAGAELWAAAEAPYFQLIERCAAADRDLDQIHEALRTYQDTIHTTCLGIFQATASSLPPAVYAELLGSLDATLTYSIFKKAKTR